MGAVTKYTSFAGKTSRHRLVISIVQLHLYEMSDDGRVRN